MRGKMGNFFPGSVGPRDHLEPKISLLFKMSRLMVIFTGLYNKTAHIFETQFNLILYFQVFCEYQRKQR